jgi:amidase
MADTYATARQMIADLAARRVSARELLDAHVARREQLHARINAVIATDIEHAIEDAERIDAARARGEPLGRLAGIPMTIKDGYDVANMPAASGNPAFARRSRNCADAALVSRARAAGAVVWGKTNVPFMLSDFQSYNAIHGTTNNPYDTARVPGGSSGGAAAALATGMTPLEIGSDIGGSLRHPANFCGVVSLKPTWGALPMRGHIPPPPGIDAEVDLGVGGPMARNVADLELLWSVLSESGGPPAGRVAGARIAIWDEEPILPLAREVKDAVARAGNALAAAGAHVERIKSPVDFDALMTNYMWLLASIIGAGFPEALLREMEASREADLKAVASGAHPWSQELYRLGVTARPDEIARAQRARDALKAAMAAFFGRFDAIVMPVAPVTAFRHDHSEPFNARLIEVDGVPAPYVTMLGWIALATALHLPALAVQAGRTPSGMPVGVQIVGPLHGEARLFDLAQAVESGLGGFAPPPGL